MARPARRNLAGLNEKGRRSSRSAGPRRTQAPGDQGLLGVSLLSVSRMIAMMMAIIAMSGRMKPWFSSLPWTCSVAGATGAARWAEAIVELVRRATAAAAPKIFPRTAHLPCFDSIRVTAPPHAVPQARKSRAKQLTRRIKRLARGFHVLGEGEAPDAARPFRRSARRTGPFGPSARTRFALGTGSERGSQDHPCRHGRLLCVGRAARRSGAQGAAGRRRRRRAGGGRGGELRGAGLRRARAHARGDGPAPLPRLDLRQAPLRRLPRG